SVTQVNEATGATPTTTSASRFTTRSSTGAAASFAAQALPAASWASTAATPRYNSLLLISDSPFMAPLQRQSVPTGMDKMSGLGTVLTCARPGVRSARRLMQVKARRDARAHAGAAIGIAGCGPAARCRPYPEETPMQFDVQLETGRIDLAAL